MILEVKKSSLLMKSFMMLLLSVFVLAACNNEDDDVEPIQDENNTVVVISDAELREIILETLNLSNPTLLTEAKMKELTELVLSNSVVENLTGLEKAENLEVLLARSIEVADLSPISGLTKLKVIDMRDAVTPTSLSFLASLNSLERIDFQNTAVANISALSGKNTLTHINLRETDVTSISALEGMTQLLFLNMNRAGGGNGITDPEITIPMDKLYYLSLRNTTLGDELFAQIYANKTQMVETNIRNTGITTVAPLVPLFEAGAFSVELSNKYQNKRSLDLQNNSITDLCSLAPWTDLFDDANELEWSAVAGDFNNCDNDAPITGDHEFIEDEELLGFILSTLSMSSPSELTEETIKNLTSLNISGSTVASLTGLEKAINLETFNAQGCGTLDNISAFAGMQKLVFLNLRQTAVSDISALEGMTQLQYLNLNRAGSGNGITNPEILTPMVNLYYISLRNTALTNEQFEMFENFDQLVECNLRNTGITTIAPLAKAFEKGAFTEELSTQYGNKLSLDLQNNTFTDLCLISQYVGVFPAGELEFSGSFSFDDCDEE